MNRSIFARICWAYRRILQCRDEMTKSAQKNLTWEEGRGSILVSRVGTFQKIPAIPAG